MRELLASAAEPADLMGAVESVKAASDIFAPVSGEIQAVNETLGTQPGLLNSSAEKDGTFPPRVPGSRARLARHDQAQRRRAVRGAPDSGGLRFSLRGERRDVVAPGAIHQRSHSTVRPSERSSVESCQLSRTSLHLRSFRHVDWPDAFAA